MFVYGVGLQSERESILVAVGSGFRVSWNFRRLAYEFYPRFRQPTDVTLLIFSEGRASVYPINVKNLHVQIISKPPINCRSRKF